jgi:hypothetical protein
MSLLEDITADIILDTVEVILVTADISIITANTITAITGIIHTMADTHINMDIPAMVHIPDMEDILVMVVDANNKEIKKALKTPCSV